VLDFIVSRYTATTKDNARASISSSRFDSVLLLIIFSFSSHTRTSVCYTGAYNNDTYTYISPYYCIIDTYLAPRSTIGGGGNSTIASGFRPKNRLLQRVNVGILEGKFGISNDICSFCLCLSICPYV
jgi:hypothetical protein